MSVNFTHVFVYVGIFALYIFRIAIFAVRANRAKRTYFLTCSRPGCKHTSKSVEAVCMLVL
nr:MAG TPA: hypothetical protein [Caudoviricetes sp.]